MIGILPFFASPLGRWLVIGLLIAGAGIAGFVKGVGYEQGRQAEIRLKEAAEFIDKMLKRAQRDRIENQMIALALDEERIRRDIDRVKFEEKLRNVPRGSLVKVYRVPSATPIASPAGQADSGSVDARLSDVACRLWNDALSFGATAAERAKWLARADTCPAAPGVEPGRDGRDRGGTTKPAGER